MVLVGITKSYFRHTIISCHYAIIYRHKLRYKQVDQENLKLEQEKEQLLVRIYMYLAKSDLYLNLQS